MAQRGTTNTPASETAVAAAVAAEIACIRGDAATLSRYLRQTARPSFDVIQNIAACLLANLPGNDLGPGDWKLTFSVRNGRPPQTDTAITSVALAIAHGRAIPLGRYLQAAPNLDRKTRHALAAALDPNPGASSKWQLKYARTRRGFARSYLKTDLLLAEIGHRALKLRQKGKLWDEIYSELPRAETLIKKAVRFVQAANGTENPRLKPPQ
jgi:hypothetical protein